jgi:hypothetical protein
VAAMLALAIDEIDGRVAQGVFPDAKALQAAYAQYTIGIFGIDLVVGTEYFHQKACVEYYIGQACGRGIEVNLPPETALCKHQYRYGWQLEPDAIIKVSELEQRQNALTARKNKAIAEIQTVDGALQECDFTRQILELRLRGAQIPYPTETS